MRGKFIVLEGTDGSGKSTLATFLGKKFSPGRLMATHAFASPFALQVKPLLISEVATTASAESRFLLSLSAHVDNLTTTVAPALESGIAVLSDRFDASNFAYQIFGERATHLASLFWELRTRLLEPYLPDLYIFLEVSPKEGLTRVTKNGKALDFFERRGVEYYTRVSEGYKEFFKTVPHIVVDANRPLEAVQEAVLAIITKHIRS